MSSGADSYEVKFAWPERKGDSKEVREGFHSESVVIEEEMMVEGRERYPDKSDEEVAVEVALDVLYEAPAFDHFNTTDVDEAEVVSVEKI